MTLLHNRTYLIKHYREKFHFIVHIYVYMYVLVDFFLLKNIEKKEKKTAKS